MTISAPIPRKTIENALDAWLKNATGLADDHVLWANQSTSPAQPSYPYATLFNASPAVKLGQDELRYRDASGDVNPPAPGSEIEQLVCGLRKMTVSCNFYSATNDADADARAIADKAHAALSLPSFLAAFQAAAGLSVINDGAVQSLDELTATQFIQRTQLDVIFGIASNVAEGIGYIETIEAEEIIKDADNANLVDVTLTLPVGAP